MGIKAGCNIDLDQYLYIEIVFPHKEWLFICVKNSLNMYSKQIGNIYIYVTLNLYNSLVITLHGNNRLVSTLN